MKYCSFLFTSVKVFILVNKKATAIFQLQSLVQLCDKKLTKYYIRFFNLVFVHLFFKDFRHDDTQFLPFFFRKVSLTLGHGIEFRIAHSHTFDRLCCRMPSDKERNTLDPFLRAKSEQLLRRFLIRNLSCAQISIDLFLFFFCIVLKVKNVFVDKFDCNGITFR